MAMFQYRFVYKEKKKDLQMNLAYGLCLLTLIGIIDLYMNI